jgi:hypothetical protein
MVHVRSTSMALVAQVRRIPTPLAITIGVLVGFMIAHMLPSSVSCFRSYRMRSLSLFLTCSHLRLPGEADTPLHTQLHVLLPVNR